MPVASSQPRGPASSERRASSSGSLAVGRGVSAGKHRTGASTSRSKAASASSSSTSLPPILTTSSPAESLPVKSILLVNSDRTADSGDTTLDDQHAQDSTSSSPSSFLKPLLKFLPRHIDPSTIARLLKNVHPSAFGAYRTKEAWRREHPEVLNTAQHIIRQEQAEAEGLLDIESSHAVFRPSVSSDEVCLAHSPPSATFSSSEDDDFDEEIEDEFERSEAKELDDYFNDEFDDDLGTSPESASSLRDPSSRRSDSFDSNSSHKQSQAIRTRESSQDSITTAKNDNPPSSSSSPSFLDELAALTISSPKSPLAIYLSKPDEEQDSPLAGPSQRVDHRSRSSSPDRSNDSSVTVTSSMLGQRQHSPIASTSAAILYPHQELNASNRPRTPPSPSSSSLSPAASPSLKSSSGSTRHPSSSSVPRSPSMSSQSRSQHYPTMPIPRIVKRQTSSSSLASSNCTCRSNTSNLSNASNASRSSSVTFAPLPEEEIKQARMESLSRNGGSVGSDRSKIMGIRGRRNLLLGLNGDEDNGSPSSPSSSIDTQSSNSRSTRDASYRRPVLDESSDDDNDYGEDGIDSPSSSSNGRNWGSPRKNDFDVIAYFGEEDSLNPPSPSGLLSVSLTRDNTIRKKDNMKGAERKGSDVTIRYGKNGESVERRPLGVTLEELTLPMKRVKETRGRSRTKTDLSAFYTSPKATSGNLASPPISPPLSHSTQHPSVGGHGPSDPTSPSRTSFKNNVEDIRIITGQTEVASPESCNEKTPMPTPRLEKLNFVLTASTPPKASTNASTTPLPSSSIHTTLSPSISNTADVSQTSGTSPTDSLHSNGISSAGSNDITPMPTPRAGSPIAGLKLTAFTPSDTHSFADHSQKLHRQFELIDSASFTLRSPSSSIRSTDKVEGNSQRGIHGNVVLDDQDKAILEISPVVNMLSLGGLLDDTLALNNDMKSTSPSSSAKSIGDPSSDKYGNQPRSESLALTENKRPGETIIAEDLSQFSSEEEEEGESDFDEKTPTLQSTLDLPKLNDTTHTLHSKYRKKRTVGTPHHVTARKKAPSVSSKKSKKL